MAPRPSMGVPAPRAMPPYKYATGVRNPNPQVVQPALQQVRQRKHLSSLHHSLVSDWLKISFWTELHPCGLFQAQPAVHVQGQEPLTASMLAAAPPQEQKQMLGKLRRSTRSKIKSCTYGCCLFPLFLLFCTNRWASLPADPVHARQPGGEDHRHAARDRQLRVAAHVGVSWISALKGTWRKGPLKKTKKTAVDFCHLCLEQVQNINVEHQVSNVPPGGRGRCCAPGPPGQERRHSEGWQHD